MQHEINSFSIQQNGFELDCNYITNKYLNLVPKKKKN